ncbi:MAG: BA14K family protein [Rhizobiaceae bacterium]|nr:BA14K family protein [Rhizobiaceae bacterium]
MRAFSKLICAGFAFAGALIAGPQLAVAQDGFGWGGTVGVGPRGTFCDGYGTCRRGTETTAESDLRALGNERYRPRRSGGHVHKDGDAWWKHDRGRYDDDRRWNRRYYNRRGADVYIDLYVPSYRYQEPRYVEPRYVPRRVIRLSDAHVNWCYNRYKSYREWDNSFNPGKGRPRRQCYSPYS